MPNGVVKWFSRDKGFGFIVPEGAEVETKDVFVHHSGILMQGYRVLETGQRVAYKVKEAENGPMAYDVVVELNKSGEQRVCPTCHQVIVPAPTPAQETPKEE